MAQSPKFFALLLAISMLSIAAANQAVEPDCGSCSKHRPTPTTNPPSGGGGGGGLLPPVTLPPINLPPVLPKLPPVGVPNLPLPPVTGPLTPVVTPPTKGAPCAPTPPASCPIDALKLGACVDLLGGLVHVGLGDPAVNECCPVLAGLVEIEAAVCLCTTLKIKALNLNIFVPVALSLLATCGKTPPPGFTCPVL